MFKTLFEDSIKDHFQSTRSGDGGSMGSALWKLQMDKNVPYHVAILSPHYENLAVHFTTEGMALCNMLYFSPNDENAYCEECNKPGYQGQGLARPIIVRTYVGYCFDNVNKMRTSKNGKEYSVNPLCLVEVRSGKKGVNYEDLDSAIASSNEEDHYLVFSEAEPTIWKFKTLSKDNGGGMAPPSVLSNKEQKNLTKGMELTVPAELLEEWLNKPAAEVSGIILSSYANVKRDHEKLKGVIFPARKVEETSSSFIEDLDLD